MKRLLPLRGDIAAIILGLAIMGLAAFGMITLAGKGRPSSFGFGSGWDCFHPGDGDPVCIKKPASTSPFWRVYKTRSFVIAFRPTVHARFARNPRQSRSI
jgi:hypothetical protein